MPKKHYPVNHHLLVISTNKSMGNGTWEETWYWDVYTSDLEGYGMIRCECNSNGRNIVIPWFKTEEINLTEVAKNACYQKMQN